MEKSELKALAKAIVDEMETRESAEFADKWEGGTIFFMPGDKDTQEHEMPLERFMHKITMVRDNLRVLEQQINSNSSLSEAEKKKYQGYITKSYGSLTSFNFIFRNNEDKFSSK